MIKLPDGELRDYLPSTMKNDTDMVCLSYALKKATERLFGYQKHAMVYHFIDILPEQIIDVLAVELRAPYYSDSMDIKTKRNIIKNTLRWHMKAGTPAAVNEMIEAVFGEGKVLEWPDFDEPPYTPGTFDVVSSAPITEKGIDQLLSVIERVKNKRSHLRRVLIKRRADQKLFTGTGQFLIYKPPAIIDGYEMMKKATQNIYAGTMQSTIGHPPAIIDGYEVMKEATQNIYAGTMQSAMGHPPAIIDGYIKQKTASSTICTGIGESSHTHQSAILECLNFDGEKICQSSKAGAVAAMQMIKPTAVTGDLL